MRERDFGDHGVLAERGAAHVVIERLAVVAEAARAVGHHALALGRAHGHAQIGLAALAEQTLAAFGGVKRDHVIARLHAGHAFTHFHDDPGALVAEHDGEEAFGVVAGEREGIGMTNAGMRDLDQHLTLAGRFDVDLDDLEGLARRKRNCSTRFHSSPVKKEGRPNRCGKSRGELA